MADVDRELHRKVNTVNENLIRVNALVDQVGQAVQEVDSAQRRTSDQLAQLAADFLAYTRASERRANLQRAETRIGVLQDQLEHEFGHHKVVRRTAVGLLQAFDVGLVSEDVARSVSEQLMIQTPRYWLAPALVAISAWAGDDAALCDKAVAEAYRRDPAKTSLLLMLVTRRQSRTGASNRWLQHYLRAQDPLALGGDFAVILESVAQGAFGPAGRATVDEVLASWSAALSNSSSHDAQVERWRAEVEGFRGDDSTRAHSSLARISPEWPALRDGLRRAEGHALLLDRYRAVMREAPAPANRLEDALDDILDRLVNEFDVEELPLRRDLSFNEAVVSEDGDLDAARGRAALSAAALEPTLDYLSIQSMSALEPDTIGVSSATQRIAITTCREWFAAAQAQVTTRYRAELPVDVRVVFDTAHTAGAATFQLPRWEAPFSDGLPRLEADLARHWDAHGDAFVRSLAYPWKNKAIVPGIVVFVVALLTFAISPAFGLFVTLVVGGIWAFVIYRRHLAALEAQRRAREMVVSAKAESLRQLREGSAELTDWGTRFQAADAEDADVKQFIASLSTEGASATPYERRTIVNGASA